MDVISKQFMEEYDRGLKQNALVPLDGKVDQLDRTVVKQVRVGTTSYSPENGVVTLPEGGGSGTVTGIKVGQNGTKMEPDENGVVQIPKYTENAAPNVQADWNQTDNTKDDYIKNKPTIPSGDVFLTSGCLLDTVDNYTTDDHIGQWSQQNIKGSAFLYDIGNANNVYYSASGNHIPNGIRLLWYDKNLFLIGKTDYGIQSEYSVPTGAVYVSFVLYYNMTEIGHIEEGLPNISFSFLGNGKIYISKDLKYPYAEPGSYNVNLDDYSESYIEGDASSANYGKFFTDGRGKGICIPYSLFKDYDYVEIKQPSSAKGGISRIHFLKNEPKANGEEVVYSSYYSTNAVISRGNNTIFYKISDDTRYIIIYAFYGNSDRRPERIVLRTSESLSLDNMSKWDERNETVIRNPNQYQIKILHFNIGNYSNGGSETSISDSNYTAKKNSWQAFINKYKDYNIYINEWNDVFAKLSSGNVYAGPELWNYGYSYHSYVRCNDTDELGCVPANTQVAHKVGVLTSLAGMHLVGDDYDYYSMPKPYIIYRHYIGGGSLYIFHTHLPTRLSDAQTRTVFAEIVNIMSGYSNAVICGDFNNKNNPSSMDVFRNAGYTVANNNDYTYPYSSASGWILDWFAYKGSFTNVSFKVCKDAVDSGYSDGDINHMLSDHWPIALTLNYTGLSIVPAVKGAYRFNPTTNLPEWHNGQGWISGGGGGGGGNYLPLAGGMMTGNIGYQGTMANSEMIKFIDNTSDAYGNGVAIGGGGATIIGGGESSDVMASQLGGGAERMLIGNDGSIEFYSNLQDGWNSRKTMVFGADGKLDVGGQLKTTTFLASHNAVGTDGTAGWVGIADIKVTSAWASQPLKFRVSQRGRSGGVITLRFTSSASAADTGISEFSYTGEIVAARIVRNGTVFSLYIQKSEAYDSIAISLVDMGSYANIRLTVTWTDTLSTADPGGTAATLVVDNNIVIQNKYKETALMSTLLHWGYEDFKVDNKISLLHFSDIHGYIPNLRRIVEYYEYYNDYLDAAIHTGDSVGNVITDGSAFDYVPSAKNILNVPGNHEARLSTSDDDYYGTEKQVYDKIFKDYIGNWGVVQPQNAAILGKCYYYKDIRNFRLIVIDSVHWHTGGNAHITDDASVQKAWFQEVLADAKANSKMVICALHYPPVNGLDVIDGVKGFNEYGVSGTAVIGDGWYAQDEIFSCVDTFINSGGKFMGWLAGHTHGDYIGFVHGHNNQIMIIVGTAGSTSGTNKNVMGTTSQDRFNIITFSCLSSSEIFIKILRVGNDKDMYNRSKVILSYDLIRKRVIEVE